MDLAKKFLPDEKLLRKYEDISINRKGNSKVFITNHRVFLGDEKLFSEFDCQSVDYLERGTVTRFSKWWQLLIFPVAVLTIGKWIPFLILGLISILMQLLTVDSLTIGTKTKKWLIFADFEVLDAISKEMKMNAWVGTKEEGKSVLEAESITETNDRIDIKIFGENESRPLKLAWISAILSFLAYYLSTFGPKTQFWTFLFAIISFCFFTIYRDRKKTNEIRNIDPAIGWTGQIWHFILGILNIPVIKTNWSFQVLGYNLYARKTGYVLFSSTLIVGVFATVLNASMIPLLLSIIIGFPIYTLGRTLSGIPRPWKRMLIRSGAYSVATILVVLPCFVLIPLYETASIKLPTTYIQGDSGNGWKTTLSQYDSYGLGFASTTFMLFIDDGEDGEGESDGYPAMLIVVAIKVPIDLEEADALSELDKQFKDMTLEQDIELEENIEQGTRTNNQGYETQYVIYNGTAKSERIGDEDYGYNVTKGSKTLYIGEVWKATEYNLLVVAMGIAIISSEEINDQTGIEPIDELIDDLIPNKPTDTTDMKNWNEMYNLIPEIICVSID